MKKVVESKKNFPGAFEIGMRKKGLFSSFIIHTALILRMYRCFL